MKETVTPCLIFTTFLNDIGSVRRGDVSDVHLVPGDTMICSMEELEQAAEQVKKLFAGQFEYKDCKLTSLQYEEKYSLERTGQEGYKIIVFQGFFEIGEEPVFKLRGSKFGTCTWEVCWDEKQENWKADQLHIL